MRFQRKRRFRKVEAVTGRIHKRYRGVPVELKKDFNGKGNDFKRQTVI